VSKAQKKMPTRVEEAKWDRHRSSGSSSLKNKVQESEDRKCKVKYGKSAGLKTSPLITDLSPAKVMML
jgi:hypothetical protein